MTDVTEKKSEGLFGGRLSWRVTLSVFITILLVELVLLILTSTNYKTTRVNELMTATRAAAVQAIDPKQNPPISSDNALRLLNTTDLAGLAVYGPEGVYQDIYGEPPLLNPTRMENGDKIVTWQDDKAPRYEASFAALPEISPYQMVLRMNTDSIALGVNEFILQETSIILLLSAFVTTVLLLVLGRWLIEPIFALQKNLTKAANDPDHPDRYQTHYPWSDELGRVVDSANRLITQNAKNLDRLNSQAEDRIYRLAYFDPLTRLPNRTNFIQQLDEMIHQPEQQQFAVLIADLDQFRDVNDTLGYEAGDQLLKRIAHRFRQSMTSADMIARIGEDEFGFIFPISEDNAINLDDKAQKIIDTLDNPFRIENSEFFMDCTVGIANYPEDGDQATVLLKRSETALDQAKQRGQGEYCHYSAEFDQAVQERIQIIRDMRRAIDNDEFILYYQPQLRLSDGALIGAEALIRWAVPKEDGTTELMPPYLFIPPAEQSGLIVPIGEWVLREACEFNLRCQTAGIENFRTAVNISGIQFYKSDLVQVVRDTLAQTGLRPDQLELEVTESTIMEDIETTVSTLEKLKDLGIELAIDDFGTGYSSLQYLKRFPIHRLKVDRSFIMHVTEDPEDAVIARTIISLGHNLGLKVLAEGVEEEEHAEFLRQEGCDEVQGYHYAKPMPEDQFMEYIDGMTIADGASDTKAVNTGSSA